MDDVPMALDRLARHALTAALVFSVAACGVVGDPGAVGACDLIVSTWDGKRDEILKPPYRTTLNDRPNGDDVHITLSGTNWGSTRVGMAGPGKTRSGIVDMDNELSSWVANAPGTWHFLLTSASCSRAFEVEVMPAP